MPKAYMASVGGLILLRVKIKNQYGPKLRAFRGAVNLKETDMLKPQSIPFGGGVPLDPNLIRDPRKPELIKHGPNTKSRVTRNKNESVFFGRMSTDPLITLEHLTAGQTFLKYHEYGQGSVTAALKPFCSGGGSQEDTVIGAVDAKTFCVRIAALMGEFDYRICRALIVGDENLMDVYRLTGMKCHKAAKKKVIGALDTMAWNVGAAVKISKEQT